MYLQPNVIATFFFSFLLILYGFHNIHPDPTQLPFDTETSLELLLDLSLYHGDPVALNLHLCPLPRPQQFIDEVGGGMGQLIILVLGLDGSLFGQSASFLSWSPPR